MLTFMSTFSQLRCHATTYPRALGWGGVGWGRDVNVHVKLFSTGMLRYNLPPCTLTCLDVNVHVSMCGESMEEVCQSQKNEVLRSVPQKNAVL